MNRVNLQRIVNHLEMVDEPKFNMSHFLNGSNTGYKTECETVACVVGHSLTLDVGNVLKNYKYSDGSINYLKWSIDFTGLGNGDDERWLFCFGEIWTYFDNTIKGAIKRIRYVLDNESMGDIDLSLIPTTDFRDFPNREDYDTYDDFLKELKELYLYDEYMNTTNIVKLYNC